MLTGHGRGGKSTGNTFSDLKYATDRGIAVMYLPPARKLVMTDIGQCHQRGLRQG